MGRATTLVLGEGVLLIMHTLLFIVTHLNDADAAQIKEVEHSVKHWEDRFASAYFDDFPHED